MQLSCVEAFSAALYISGFKSDAENLLSKFKWGHSFLSLNQKLLDAYSQCKDGPEVIRVQSEHLEVLEEEARRKRDDNTMDLPPSASSESESEENSEDV